MEEEFNEASLKVMRILEVLKEKKNLDEASMMTSELLAFLEFCREKSRDVVTLPLNRKIIEDAYQHSQKTQISSKAKDDDTRLRCHSVAEANYFVRRQNGHKANKFWRNCTCDNVLKTCIQGPGCVYPCLDNTFGITWVAVQAMDGSIAVVTRESDLDTTRVNSFFQTRPRDRVLGAMHLALTSEVECLPYDDDDHFLRAPSKSIKRPFSVGRLIEENIKKPFSVVSLYPIPENSDQDAGQLASGAKYDRDKAINFLMGKMDSELVATLEDAIKIALSGFKHLCCQDLKPNEYWVSKWDCKKNLLHQVPPPHIEKYLEVISEEMN